MQRHPCIIIGLLATLSDIFTASYLQRPPAMLRFFKQRFAAMTETQHKGVLLGLDYVGKTTLLYRLKNGEIARKRLAVGMEVKTFRSPAWEIASWDVGGE